MPKSARRGQLQQAEIVTSASSAAKESPLLTVAIVQARMGSTRLPGKVLMEIEGHPMLWHVVSRVRRSRFVHKTVVATSDLATDDPIAEFCKRENIPCFRGSESDVLDRYYQAATTYGASRVVRITADSPLIDPSVIDQVIQHFEAGGCDYALAACGYSFPEGIDTEVFSYSALERAWRETNRSFDREHVTAFIRQSGKFRVVHVHSSQGRSGPENHWSVDQPEDLRFVREIFQRLRPAEFSYLDVLELLAREPALRKLNRGVSANEGSFRSHYVQARAAKAPPLSLQHSMKLLSRAREIIPGVSQTFSKGPQQYVEGVSPVFLAKGRGARVWDVDGNSYIDYVQGLLANILGYANEEVNAAVNRQLAEGHCFSLPSPLEVALSERLIRLIPCAEMVRFGKNGSDATSGAIRAARKYTGRERIACCGYHGWQDWYIGSTTRNEGVPIGVQALTHPFPYNDLTALEAILTRFPGQVAAVIMEPVNFVDPLPGYLQGVKDLAAKHGAILIFDEVCTGFRIDLGGAQKLFGVTPDLACFGKAMGNGFPISCVVGRAEIMKAFEEVFFSFTFAGEAASLAAAMKVLDILESTDALQRMAYYGRVLQDGFNSFAAQAGLQERLCCEGRPIWSIMRFKDSHGKEGLLERSLFQQEVVKRGILCLVTHNLSAAHDELTTEKTLEAYAETFKLMSEWLSDREPSRHLEGKMIQSTFRLR